MMGVPPGGSRTEASWGGRLRLVEAGEGFSESHEYAEDYEHPNGFGDDRELEAPPAFEGITVAQEIARARRALLDLVLSDPSAWGVYEKQCAEGLIGMYGRAAKLRQTLEARGSTTSRGRWRSPSRRWLWRLTRTVRRRHGSGS